MILSSHSFLNWPEPTLLLSIPSVLALIAYAIAAWPGNQSWQRWALLSGWVAQGCALVMDVFGLSSPVPGARFGFAPALSISMWLVLAVYALESRWFSFSVARRSLAVGAAVAVALAWLYPGQFRPHVGSPWAPLHWVLGLASYGLFGAAILHAGLWHQQDKILRHKSTSKLALYLRRIETRTEQHALDLSPSRLPLLKLETLTFGFVITGFAVLSLTLLLGVYFARPWHWDHKTVLSVLAWIVFALLLLGRWLLGWRGRSAMRWLYAGTTLLLLAYVGSRFVFEVLLHRFNTPY